MLNKGILFFLQATATFVSFCYVGHVFNWDVQWMSWVLLMLSSNKWLGSLGNSSSVMKSHSCLPSRLVRGRREGIYSRYCKAPWVVWQYILCTLMTTLSCLFYGWKPEAHTVTFPKEFREVAYGFACVFCSVLHVLFCIKITEVEHLGLVEILLKTLL